MNDSQWYLTIRRYSGNGAPEEIAQRIRDGLLPTLRQEASFRAYYVARIDGGGGIFSATIFDDAATAKGLVGFFLRGLSSGALDEADLGPTTLTAAELATRSFAAIVAGRSAR